MLKKRPAEPKYKILTLEESMVEINKRNRSIDGKIMNDQVQYHLDFLLSKQVNKCEDFIQPFKAFGFTTNDLKHLLVEFKEFMRKDKVDIYLLRQREFKKANKSILNILYNSIILKYPNEFYSFLEDNINEYSTKSNSQNLISEFKSIIEKLI